MQSLNETLFRPLHNLAFQSDIFDTLIVFSAEYLWAWMVVGAFVPVVIFLYQKFLRSNAFYTNRNKWRVVAQYALLALFSAFVAVVFGKIIKETFASPRPFMSLTDVNPLFVHGDIDSFPSGHTTFVFALAVGIYLYSKRVGGFFVLAAIIVALSRVVAGVHWPFDILGGVVLGTIVSLSFFYIIKRCCGKHLFNH